MPLRLLTPSPTATTTTAAAPAPAAAPNAAALTAALNNNERLSLAKLLKTNPGLEPALSAGDDEKLAAALGLGKDDPQIQKLKARHLVESDMKKFSEEFRKVEKQGLALTKYEEAIVAETKKLRDRHQPMIDLLTSRTGETSGAVATRLETWDQAIAKGNQKDVAQQMAGYLRSVHDRKGFEGEIKKALSPNAPKDGLLNYFAQGTALSNRFPRNAQEKLATNASLPKAEHPEGVFARAFLKTWPEHLQAMKEYSRLRDAAITVGKNGQYTVNKQGLVNLKEKYPTLTPEWAHAVQDQKGLWGAGFDSSTQHWSFTAKKNPLEPSMLWPPTLHASNSGELQNLLRPQIADSRPANLSSVASTVRLQKWRENAQAIIDGVAAAAIRALEQKKETSSDQDLTQTDTEKKTAARP